MPDIKKRNVNIDRGFLDGYLPALLRYSIIAALSPLFFLFGLYLLVMRKISKRDVIPLTLGIFPLVLFILSLNEYSTGNFALFYPFIIPFLLGIIVKYALRIKKSKQYILFFSYPLCMLLGLYYFSDVFTGVPVRQVYLHVFFIAILMSYAIISFVLLKTVISYKLSNN